MHNKQIYYQPGNKMDFDDTESIEEDGSNPPIQYEHCPHCSRRFFKGKLKYHLKLCTANNPMIISPHKTPGKREKIIVQHDHQPLFSHQQTRCPHCNMKMPSFLIDRHAQKCPKADIKTSTIEATKEEQHKKAATDTHFKQRQDLTLPLIVRSAKQPERADKTGMRSHYKVKVREDLSCFRKAEEIKQVPCPSCGRIFSKAASLRHFPICEALKMKVDKSIALRKKSKRTNKSALQQSYSLSPQRNSKFHSAILDLLPSKSSLQLKQKLVAQAQQN